MSTNLGCIWVFQELCQRFCTRPCLRNLYFYSELIDKYFPVLDVFFHVHAMKKVILFC